jgi:hypothetical protein
MHPIIDEILRARLPIRPDVHRRWSDVLRNEIQPQLDELAELKADPPKPDAKKGRAA